MAVNHTHIALSIVAGFALVAATIFFSFSKPDESVANTYELGAELPSVDPKRENNRHVYGSSEAKITIVEFSDFQCPFCAQLHPTLERIVDESNGTIAWEYRHLPLPNHPEAKPAAIASECVADSLGTEAFWDFSKDIFASMRDLNSTVIKDMALNAGLSSEEYDRCINDSEIINRVDEDMVIAQTLGGRGTPFNVIVFADGSIRPVSGALPYEQWVTLIGNQ